MKYWKLPAAAALFFGLVAVFIVCGCGIIADKLTFLPRNDTYPGLKDISMADLETGGRIALRYLPPARPDGTVFLHCHGNSESLGSIAWRQELFHRHGYGILAFDYEGYGRSTGKASEEAVERDVLRAWKYLTEKLKIPPRRIVIHGYSLGTGAACFLASRVPEAKALILEAPFTSIYAVANLGWMPGTRFPSDKRIGKVTIPVMSTAAGTRSSPSPTAKSCTRLSAPRGSASSRCRGPGTTTSSASPARNTGGIWRSSSRKARRVSRRSRAGCT